MTLALATLARSTQDHSRARLLADALEGLGRVPKTLPCKYFYDERGSALFDRICEVDEYYPTRTELAILRADAPAMAESVGPGAVLIELGSGSSLKTRLLLAELESPSAYLPVDISREHLERAAGGIAARFPGLRVVPVHADFTAPFSLPADVDPDARRVVYFPGSTIGNFSPDAARSLLREVARLVGPGGGLLIGLDLAKDESILVPAYNDREGVTAAFNLNLLTRLNREAGGDFDLVAFAHRAVFNPREGRVEMHLVSLARQVARLSGTPIAFAEGETILTECSYKYTADHFRRLAAEAGFASRASWSDRRGYFLVESLEVA